MTDPAEDNGREPEVPDQVTVSNSGSIAALFRMLGRTLAYIAASHVLLCRCCRLAFPSSNHKMG